MHVSAAPVSAAVPPSGAAAARLHCGSHGLLQDDVGSSAGRLSGWIAPPVDVALGVTFWSASQRDQAPAMHRRTPTAHTIRPSDVVVFTSPQAVSEPRSAHAQPVFGTSHETPAGEVPPPVAPLTSMGASADCVHATAKSAIAASIVSISAMTR